MSECTCQKCRNACCYSPEWFAPGEAAQAAKLFGLNEKEFFDKYLAVDYLAGEKVFLLSPAITMMTPGEIKPNDPRGRCVFYFNERCQIHSAKPAECREYDHTVASDRAIENHIKIGMKWKGVSDQEHVADLLGRKPEEPSLSLLDLLGLLCPEKI